MGFSMYGISNLASDACGGIGTVDEELCARWTQLSVFMPLIRNYYNVARQETEYYKFQNYDYQIMTAAALDQRMSYLRYIYSQMYKVYRFGGSMVYPMFFDYPNDDSTFQDIENTYMFGDSIKVSPVLM